MYALMSQWQAEESQYEFLIQGLRTQIIPMVEQTPGFIQGVWGWDHTTGKTYDMVLYDTEENARAVKTQIEEQPEPDAPIRLEVARVVEVTGQAVAPSTART